MCEFIRNNINIDIYPLKDQSVIVKEIITENDIDRIMKDDDIVKLFYQNSSKYNGNVENWGNCKGSTYNDVCMVLNKKTYNLYKKIEEKIINLCDLMCS